MIGGRREVHIPGLVRIKPGALDKLGIYLKRSESSRVALLHSEGLPEPLIHRAQDAMGLASIELIQTFAVPDGSLTTAESLSEKLHDTIDCVVGLGGGKALDVAKLVATKAKAMMFSLPTSLSNDGFASPQSSLVDQGHRRSFAANLPGAVIVDTEVCLAAPKILWLSGVGDLVAKLTAVRDWKLAFHHDGTLVDDFAALLSDASVFQFMARPEHDLEGIRLLATALMLNGVSMAICGSSRPASGGEHLISHALDAISSRPRLHGLQVGMATYLVSQLQRNGTDAIGRLFDTTGFWNAIRSDPFSRSEWQEAIERAPSMKPNFYTILSKADQLSALLSIIDTDPCLEALFSK